METVVNYNADDELSMPANNTSAFNCRAITGTAVVHHAYGRAIDLNPLHNPYIARTAGFPPTPGHTSTATGLCPA